MLSLESLDTEFLYVFFLSFSLVFAPSKAMQNKGDILDLVLFSGCLLDNVLCRDISVSDPILFF